MLASFPIAAQNGEAIEARSAHFRVSAREPDQIARRAAAVLEQTRSQLAALGFTPADSITDVVLFPSRAEMRPYALPVSDRPAGMDGFFQAGPGGLFIAVAWREAGDPWRALAHELAHEAMLQESRGYPLWLKEGVADVLSNAQAAGGDANDLKIGAPIRQHVSLLRRGSWLPWRQVLSAAAGDALFGDSKSRALFYAQSWLLAREALMRLSAGGNEAGGQGPATLAGKLGGLQFAAKPEGCPRRLPQRFLAWKWRGMATNAETAGGEGREEKPAARGAAVRRLAAWEMGLRLARLLEAENRTAEARAALISLRSRFPGRPEPADELGALEMAALHAGRAEEWLGAAARLGSENAEAYYKYSLLLMSPCRPQETGCVPQERAAMAAKMAQRAVEIDPAPALYWLAKAQAEAQLSQWEAARNSVEQMRERTGDPVLLSQATKESEEIERLREQQERPVKELAARVPQKPAAVKYEEMPAGEPDVQAPGSPTVSAPAPPAAPGRGAEMPALPKSPSWLPPGTVMFPGTIREVECSAGQKTLTVVTALSVIHVRETAGQRARLYNPPSKWNGIPCSVRNLPANVVYRPAQHPGRLNGDLVAVIF